MTSEPDKTCGGDYGQEVVDMQGENRKRNVLIERVDGELPPLGELNRLLAKRYGIAIALVIDYAGEVSTPARLDNFRLCKAHINAEDELIYRPLSGEELATEFYNGSG